MSNPFWLNDPSILINSEYISDIWPLENMSQNEKLNSISRIIIILTIIGVLITQSFRLLITGIITLGVIVIFYLIEKNKSDKKENFISTSPLTGSIFDKPDKENPLMNVMITDYDDNPNKKPAAPAFDEEVEPLINKKTKDFVISQFDSSNKNEEENIEKRLFQDLGDNFVFDQSMRNYYSTPNTTIPNDQKAFAEFCYGDMPSCKEGNSTSCEKFNLRWTNGQQ